jgi:outer membrane lipoprotein-sorting protein
MKKQFAFILFILLIASFNLFAQNELLKSVQDKYRSVSDFSASFQKSTNGKVDMNGKIFYKKGNKARIEMKNTTLITDGKTTWSHNRKDNKVVINDFSSADASLLSLDEILNNYPSKSEVSSSTEDGKQILQFKPKKGSGLNFNNAKLYLNNNNLIERVVITNSPGSVSEVKLTGYELNKNITDSQFSFNPPEGSTVIDLR